ncbi:hypothetical protein GAP52_085 [Cronobacter phage vB_CsaP_GAP52]|uniref:Uncharacterized protein n=1 Tax=Cronobacter phage vB_CsaP_GAP52 TaxID=1141137 RepID=K4FBC0_9CAUD|nr:hypothetical protein D858_gp029 [Cronobacter phage vB_CsaP_GAP52]AFC22079.1 hypothetical protein GAP52_085 [Cronobacter phage vB_CsaP_GAP52]
MSVKFDVVYKDGFKLKTTSICFGVMEKGRWNEINGFRQMEREGHADCDQRFIQFYTNFQVHPMWAHDEGIKRDWPRGEDNQEGRNKASKKFLAEMKEIQKDLPFLQGLVTFHPLLHVARVHIKNHTVDQIMLALFLVRNLCHYSNNCFTYRWLRETHNLRPALAAVLCHQFSMDLGSFNRHSWSPAILGEYNWINPQTFGKQALLRFMTQDKDTAFEYRQGMWKASKGYRRDEHFSRNDDIFDSEIGGSNRYWKMVAPFSIPGDEPINDNQYKDRYSGFVIGRSFNSELTQGEVENYIAGVKALLEENNIPATL